MHDATPLSGMIGRHPAMLEVYRTARLAARADLPVLIVGETGSGKELVARALHDLSAARGGPFVDVNCAAVPDGLAEGEFFGWEQGAFTGALHARPGLVETAHGGTLFLDEACSLPVILQAKLLRVIEQKDFRRVGGRRRLASQFRLVAAISEGLPELVRSGRMRADFAHRISGLAITLPPLRERGADVRLLAEHFLRAAARNAHPPKGLDGSALDILGSHPWPGNVRELRLLMERLHVFLDRPAITALDVLPLLRIPDTGDPNEERVSAVLAAHRWNVRAAARTLGVGRTKMYQLLERFGLKRPVNGVRADAWSVRPNTAHPAAARLTSSWTEH